MSVQAWAPVLVGAALAYAALAAAVARREAPGARVIGLGLAAIACWIGAAGAEAMVSRLEWFVFWTQLKYTAVALVPPSVYLFYLHYVGSPAARARWAAVLWVVPVVTVVLTWTNPLHGWMWQHPPIGPHGELLVRPVWGAYFWWVHTPYSYGLLLAAFGSLGARLLSESRLFRAQTALVLASGLLPLAVNAAYLMGYGRDGFSFTPVAFAVAGVGLAWGFLRLGLFQLTPVAYRSVFDHIQDAVLVVGEGGQLVDLNPSAARLLGARAGAALGRPLERAGGAGSALAALASGPPGRHAELGLPDGTELEVAVSDLRDGRGLVSGRAVILRDVTARRRVQAALHESEALVRSIVEHSPNGILRLRPVRDRAGAVRDFECVLANPAAGRLLGEDADKLIGRRFHDAPLPHAAFLLDTFRDVLRSGKATDIERPVGPPEDPGWLRFLAVPVGEELTLTCVDVTDRKRREERMEAAARLDPLTGLLNRRGFDEDAGELLLRAGSAGRPFALLVLDLDRFKQVNDSHGHVVGDAVLCAFAERVRVHLRADAPLARYGGDEFVALLPDVEPGAAVLVAERIQAAAAEVYRVEGARVACPASVGVAHHPEDGRSLEELMRAADAAMYEAKHEGRAGS